MITALDEGIVDLYVHDVWDNEPPHPDDPMLTHPKCIGTSHDLWLNGIGRMLKESNANVASFVAGSVARPYLVN